MLSIAHASPFHVEGFDVLVAPAEADMPSPAVRHAAGEGLGVMWRRLIAAAGPASCGEVRTTRGGFLHVSEVLHAVVAAADPRADQLAQALAAACAAARRAGRAQAVLALDAVLPAWPWAELAPVVAAAFDDPEAPNATWATADGALFDRLRRRWPDRVMQPRAVATEVVGRVRTTMLAPPPPEPPRAAAASEPRQKRAVIRKSQPGEAGEHARRLALAEGRPRHDYGAATRPAEGDVLVHPVLGDGVIVKLRGTKWEVMFASGTRTLVAPG